jgi:hypothetical protein
MRYIMNNSVSYTTTVTKMCVVSQAEVSVYTLGKLVFIVLKRNRSLKRSGARAGSYGLSLIHTYLQSNKYDVSSHIDIGEGVLPNVVD